MKYCLRNMKCATHVMNEFYFTAHKRNFISLDISLLSYPPPLSFAHERLDFVGRFFSFRQAIVYSSTRKVPKCVFYLICLKKQFKYVKSFKMFIFCTASPAEYRNLCTLP